MQKNEKEVKNMTEESEKGDKRGGMEEKVETKRGNTDDARSIASWES